MKRARRDVQVSFLLCLLSLQTDGRISPPKEYDFIIVGAGAAGCLLASRLSENPDWKVLLIEAGGEENALQDVPLLASALPLTSANWDFKCVKNSSYCQGMKNGRCSFARGKVLGGTTVLNYLVYSRGNKIDYDAWEQMGNDDWGYESVLPYFKKSENMLIHKYAQDTTYHSTEGELPVSHPPYHTKAATAFLESTLQNGFEIVDYNAESQIGFDFPQAMMKNGKRWSANTAFLKPVRCRKNLQVETKSLVTKILIGEESRAAYGVEYMRRWRIPVQAVAKREVILCAGSINSPKLLMLSGIGPEEHLRDLGIPVLQNSKVGSNLQEHITPGNLYFTLDQDVGINMNTLFSDYRNLLAYVFKGSGIFSIPSAIEVVGFLNTTNRTNSYPDIEFAFLGTTSANTISSLAWGVNSTINSESYSSLEAMSAFQIILILLKPFSRGRILLNSTNPFDQPLIYPNFFSDPRDLQTLVQSVRKAQQIVSAPPLQKYGAKLYDKPLSTCRDEEFDSDDYWECCLRHIAYSLSHHSGTCKMGPDSDPDAVVDPTLKVRGIQNLRVVDTSIFPDIPTCHPTAPVYMTAEKAAHMIKQHWK